MLFGELPDKKELAEFTGMIGDMRRLPTNFVRDVIMKAPSKDIMNSMTRSVLTLSSYDPNVSDLSIENVLKQWMMLISVFHVSYTHLDVYKRQVYTSGRFQPAL